MCWSWVCYNLITTTTAVKSRTASTFINFRLAPLDICRPDLCTSAGFVYRHNVIYAGSSGGHVRITFGKCKPRSRWFLRLASVIKCLLCVKSYRVLNEYCTSQVLAVFLSCEAESVCIARCDVITLSGD